jgi:NAD(P)-dependent dehydrogenase (short-subunit alcohol dehydrogenase family)
MSYYPGSEGGQAIAETLFGEHNPSGRLPITVPRSAGHLPSHFDQLAHPTPIGDDEHPDSYDPLYAFGHGLSYTEFDLREFEVTDAEVGPADDVEATEADLLACARAALPQLRQHDRGAIMVTGASAAWRGRANTAPFASAKAAQRSLAQSLARQLGPEQIHVAYVVIDGVIDLPRTREKMPDKPDEFFLNPDAIADSVWALVQQDQSAWTFELDLRPFGESW